MELQVAVGQGGRASAGHRAAGRRSMRLGLQHGEALAALIWSCYEHLRTTSLECSLRPARTVQHFCRAQRAPREAPLEEVKIDACSGRSNKLWAKACRSRLLPPRRGMVGGPLGAGRAVLQEAAAPKGRWGQAELVGTERKRAAQKSWAMHLP